MRDARRERAIDARRSGDAQFVPRGLPRDPAARFDVTNVLRRRLAHRCDRVRERGDAADVIPVRVRRENVRHDGAELLGAVGDPLDLIAADAGVDGDRFVPGGEEQGRRPPERALEPFDVHERTLTGVSLGSSPRGRMFRHSVGGGPGAEPQPQSVQRVRGSTRTPGPLAVGAAATRRRVATFPAWRRAASSLDTLGSSTTSSRARRRTDDRQDHSGWFCVRTNPFPCPARGCTFIAEFMTAAHLILVWQERDDPNLLRHAERAKQVGRNPRIREYESIFGPSASYYAWEAAGGPVHGVRAQ